MRFKRIYFSDLPREVKDTFFLTMKFNGNLTRTRGKGFLCYVYTYTQKDKPNIYTIEYIMNNRTDEWYVGDSRNDS